MVEWKDAVGKKVLIREVGKGQILEVYVVELSPSGKYAKIRRDWAFEKWIDTGDYVILEVLD